MFIETSALNATNVEHAFIGSLGRVYDVVSKVCLLTIPNIQYSLIILIHVRLARPMAKKCQIGVIFKLPQLKMACTPSQSAAASLVCRTVSTT